MGVKKHYILYTRDRLYYGHQIFPVLREEILQDTLLSHREIGELLQQCSGKGTKTCIRLAWEFCRRYDIHLSRALSLREYTFRSKFRRANKYLEALQAARQG